MKLGWMMVGAGAIAALAAFILSDRDARDVRSDEIPLQARSHSRDAAGARKPAQLGPLTGPLESQDDPVFDAPEPATPESAEEESRLIIAPVIAAIRGNFANAEERRNAMLDALRASGESDEAWTAGAPSTFAGFRRAMPNLQDIQVNETHTECFRAGCQATVRFHDAASYELAADAFRHIEEEAPAHGGRVQTPGVELPDGRVEATWIVLRPST